MNEKEKNKRGEELLYKFEFFKQEEARCSGELESIKAQLLDLARGGDGLYPWEHEVISDIEEETNGEGE